MTSSFAGTGGRTVAMGYAGDGVRQQFTAYERDVESGLDFAGARFYSSTQGRFTSVDPLMASSQPASPQPSIVIVTSPTVRFYELSDRSTGALLSYQYIGDDMQNSNAYTERHRMSFNRQREVALAVLIPVLAFFIACNSKVRSEVRQQEARVANVAALCESLKEIEILPMKDEPVSDPAYNALVSAGDEAIPCLIRKITDETKMADPRQAPKVGFVFVGDTAFFVLADIAKLDQTTFVELLPPDVRKAYEGGEGINGYFRYINEDNNRKKLQDAAVKWYEKKYGRSLP